MGRDAAEGPSAVISSPLVSSMITSSSSSSVPAVNLTLFFEDGSGGGAPSYLAACCLFKALVFLALICKCTGCGCCPLPKSMLSSCMTASSPFFSCYWSSLSLPRSSPKMDIWTILIAISISDYSIILLILSFACAVARRMIVSRVLTVTGLETLF